MAKQLGKKPVIVPDLVKKYTKDWILSSSKAETALGYTTTPVKTALEKTVNWIRSLN
jgi:hypothetical protein